MERRFKATMLVVDEGAVYSARVYAKHPGVFGEVLKYRRRFMKLDQSSVDKVECRCTYTMNMRTAQWNTKGP